MVQNDKLLYLLEAVQRFDMQQKEIQKLKGENFNIFSILNMESKENATHSAFIGELLNPKGSHLLKSKLLNHFLEVVDYKKEIDLKSVVLKLEYYIGEVNHKTQTGGRIDIFLIDKNGVSISIENKIYASDQKTQIQRYVNHNHGKNTVLYLNLNGDSPTEESKGSLEEENQDFQVITYRKTIIEWLSLCLKEAADQPILRESIKQYMLLLKKLTNQLSDSVMEENVLNAIKENFDAAHIVANNLWKVELELANQFLEDLKNRLSSNLIDNYQITVDDDLTKAWTGLRVHHKDWNEIIIKLEGQSKFPWSSVIYGISANKNKWNREDFKKEFIGIELLNSGFSSNKTWPFKKTILHFNRVSERKKLIDNNQRTAMLDDLEKKLTELIKVSHHSITKINKIIK